jgi:hypothetical protein
MKAWGERGVEGGRGKEKLSEGQEGKVEMKRL